MKHLFIFICFIVFISANSCVKYVDRIVEVPAKQPTDSSGCTSSTDIKICFTKTKPCMLDAEEFTFTCSGTDVPGDANFEWYFGDGESCKGNNFTVKHSFYNADYYSVLLKVKTKDNRDIGEKRINVTAWGQNMTPTVKFEWYQDNIVGTSSTYLFQNTYYGGAGACDYNWDFGDGKTGQGRKIYHTYQLKETPQTITVTLTVTSAAGCKKTETKTVILPVAFNINDSLSYTKTDPCSGYGEEFTFKAPVRNYPAGTQYVWDFGDGSQSNTDLPMIKKRFTFNHGYDVKLKIVNGSQVYFNTILPVFALGIEAKPKVSFIYWEINQNATSIEYFFNNAQSAGGGFSLENWYWNYGDGSPSQNSKSATAKRIYTKQAKDMSYTVTMVGTSSSGCADTAITTVFVPKL